MPRDQNDHNKVQCSFFTIYYGFSLRLFKDYLHILVNGYKEICHLQLHIAIRLIEQQKHHSVCTSQCLCFEIKVTMKIMLLGEGGGGTALKSAKGVGTAPNKWG